jgi:hypothetical protein
MQSTASNWKIYRTRFLIKAKQLDAPLVFTDPLGREHSGRKGDYLVESSDGLQRIAPREIFEDIYVPMGRGCNSWPSPSEATNLDQPNRSLHEPQLGQRRTAANRPFVA